MASTDLYETFPLPIVKHVGDDYVKLLGAVFGLMAFLPPVAFALTSTASRAAGPKPAAVKFVVVVLGWQTYRLVGFALYPNMGGSGEPSFPFPWLVPLTGDGIVGLVAPWYCWLAATRTGPQVYALVMGFLFFGCWDFIAGISIAGVAPPSGEPQPPKGVGGMDYWLLGNLVIEFAAICAALTGGAAAYYAKSKRA